MVIEGCNATIQPQKAFYPLADNLSNMSPAIVELTVQIRDQEFTLTVPLQQYNAKGIQKQCLHLRFHNRKAQAAFNDALTADLLDGLTNGTIQCGYYIEKAGAVTFPDGHTCFIRGPELLGLCSRPYLLAPEISMVRLLGRGTLSTEILSLLLASPHQVLLVFAYVILTSIRSLIIGEGIDLQAVLYIVGGQGLGKTTLATRIAGIYEQAGKPTGIVQAGSTHAAVNAMMASSRDQPVVIDDLCLSASRETARKRVDLASKLIRQGTGCIPITKKSGSSTVELPCEAGLIITAEFHLENLSDLTRCIIVPIQKQLHIPDDLTPSLVGDAVRHYSLWLTEHIHEEINRYRVAVNSAVAKNETDTRIATNYACLKAAFQSFIRSLDGVGGSSNINMINLSFKKINKALTEAKRQHQAMIEQIKDSFPAGNLSFCILEGYHNGAFDLTQKIEKL